ncbi:MAG: hypothetical protein A2086_09635 [Spirochaetes bacterium GWD1_27_9]|nr:MAG: hypothetical protein A2Z98_13560 [Spirochaetes bacterium GWB1_27_13]OHD25984.1 MAG: hypothetical protein A2Y34_07065 [Spirochaetes bacterium GWC1_27_15]OHD31662.1 MAG: hypothetical protein A2086_09635 [Spirochaetes bacterium GWD1_27_9]
MQNFTAIDFETANFESTSACQIGLVVIKDKKIIKEFSSYIKPVPNYFVSRFTNEIHGIDSKTVAKSPTFDKVWLEICQFIENSEFIVAHNASFDIKVLTSCLSYYNIEYKLPPHFCTCKASRKKLPNVRNHKLSTLCDYFGVPLNHHEALSDARGAAMLALKLDEII